MKSILMMFLAFSLPASEQAKFDLEKLSKLVNASDPQISPDGKSIAIVVSRPDYEMNLYRSELVLVVNRQGHLSTCRGDQYVESDALALL